MDVLSTNLGRMHIILTVYKTSTVTTIIEPLVLKECLSISEYKPTLGMHEQCAHNVPMYNHADEYTFFG